MNINIENKTNTINLDFKNDIILTNGKPAITMNNQIYNKDVSKLNISNATFIDIKSDTKLKTLIKLIKFVYKKENIYEKN